MNRHPLVGWLLLAPSLLQVRLSKYGAVDGMTLACRPHKDWSV